VITNGVEETQRRRLKRSGLFDFFEDLFYSQSIGFQKPSKEYFDYVMGHIRDFHKEEALIIGDSLTTDIKGGLSAGIDTCWINTKSQEAPRRCRARTR
jgi:2-haloacid dehalogenase